MSESAVPDFEAKVVAPDKLGDSNSLLHQLPRPIVFTNGVFDLLHRGHVTCLAQARAHGGSLIVGLNDDDSVRRLGKGPDRPINKLADRAAVLAALQSTSLITWFSQDTPLELIRTIKPDVLVKGGDWPVDQIVGADIVLASGGKVLSIAFEHQRSTTQILKGIRE